MTAKLEVINSLTIREKGETTRYQIPLGYISLGPKSIVTLEEGKVVLKGVKEILEYFQSQCKKEVH